MFRQLALRSVVPAALACALLLSVRPAQAQTGVEFYAPNFGFHFQLVPYSDGTYGALLTRGPKVNTAAARLGLLAGDTVLRVNDQAFYNAGDVMKHWFGTTVVYSRPGQATLLSGRVHVLNDGHIAPATAGAYPVPDPPSGVIGTVTAPAGYVGPGYVGPGYVTTPGYYGVYGYGAGAGTTWHLPGIGAINTPYVTVGTGSVVVP